MTPALPCAEEAPRNRVHAVDPPARSKSPFRHTAVMQVAILLASVGLIFVQLRIHAIGRAHGLPRLAANAEAGQLVSRDYIAGGKLNMPSVDDPARVKALLPPGSSYEILIKGGFETPLEDAADGRGVRYLAFAYETLTRRTIESNDGRRIVERRRFESRKLAKLVTDAGPLSLDLGAPQTPVLQPLGDVRPGEGPVDFSVRSVADAILSADSQPTLDGTTSRAALCEDRLSGKEVRITYVDGLGVESVAPIGCSLTNCELKMLFHTPVLADCYLLPDPNSRERKWQVNADQLAGFFDPTLPAIPRGRLRLQSMNGENDPAGRPRRYVSIVDGADIDLIAADVAYGRVGFLTFEGTFHQGPNGLVDFASLGGPIRIIAVSQDYFLFDEVFYDAAPMTLTYSCMLDQDHDAEAR